MFEMLLKFLSRLLVEQSLDYMLSKVSSCDVSVILFSDVFCLFIAIVFPVLLLTLGFRNFRCHGIA